MPWFNLNQCIENKSAITLDAELLRRLMSEQPDGNSGVGAKRSRALSPRSRRGHAARAWRGSAQGLMPTSNKVSFRQGCAAPGRRVRKAGPVQRCGGAEL